jgi:hypothetical protein
MRAIHSEPVVIVSDPNVACFPAFRTIVQAIDAEPNVVHRLAKAAVLLTFALRLGLVALRTNSCHEIAPPVGARSSHNSRPRPRLPQAPRTGPVLKFGDRRA